MSVLDKKMYCYFLIWGVGMSIKKKLFEEIYNDSDFDILTVLEHKPKKLKILSKEFIHMSIYPLVIMKLNLITLMILLLRLLSFLQLTKILKPSIGMIQLKNLYIAKKLRILK